MQSHVFDRAALLALMTAALAGCATARETSDQAHARCDVEPHLWRVVRTPPAAVLAVYRADKDTVSTRETLWFVSNSGAYTYCWPHDTRDDAGHACGAVRGVISQQGEPLQWLVGPGVTAPCMPAPTDY